MSFKRGDHTLFTYDRPSHDRNELILPVTVIEDSPSQSIVYLAAGTPIGILIPESGEKPPRNTPYKELAAIKRVPGESIWTGTNVLMCWRPEWTWDVRLMWNAETREFQCWYLNIQDLVKRTPAGFRTTDHFLDVVIAPDGTTSLKDEVELDDATSIGMYPAQQRDEFHETAKRAIEHFESGAWPFNLGWETFRPDDEWALPTLREP